MDNATSTARSADTSGTLSRTELITETTDGSTTQAPVLRLRLQKPKSGRKVSWTSETIDNEELNKKKSKCCCVYHKPLEFGESSSESEDDCDHCAGHVDKRKKNQSSHKKECSDNNGSCPLNEESPTSTTNPI